jgi:glucan 1,3-beta-glucosidase
MQIKHLTDLRISQTAFGVTVTGEYSNAINDCGLFVLGVGNSATYPGNCTTFNDWQNWNQSFIDGFLDFALASMDATYHSFFWTWKVG